MEHPTIPRQHRPLAPVFRPRASLNLPLLLLSYKAVSSYFAPGSTGPAGRDLDDTLYDWRRDAASPGDAEEGAAPGAARTPLECRNLQLHDRYNMHAGQDLAMLPDRLFDDTKAAKDLSDVIAKESLRHGQSTAGKETIALQPATAASGPKGSPTHTLASPEAVAAAAADAGLAQPTCGRMLFYGLSVGAGFGLVTSLIRAPLVSPTGMRVQTLKWMAGKQCPLFMFWFGLSSQVDCFRVRHHVELL